MGQKKFEVLSRGITSPEHSNLRSYKMEYDHTEPYLKKIGIEIPFEQKAILIDKKIVEQSSLILAMDEKILHSLKRQFPNHISKMHLFMELAGKKENVPDCCGSNNPDLHKYVVLLIDEVTKIEIEKIKTFIHDICVS